MFQVDNFISFHDLTPEAHFLWASSSITTCLGYEPEEIVDTPAYTVIHLDDISYVKVSHQENMMNEMVGTQIALRFKAKDGSWVPCMALFSLCYDYIVTCSTVIAQTDGTIRQLTAHSAAMTSLVGSRQEEFARIKRHHQAFGTNTWNPNGLEPEPRACMILNRFSRSLGIMYASPSCHIIFGVEPDQIVGKPFLLFIRADDLASFVEQVDLAKASNIVTHMRFWFQSPKHRQEIPCEAMLFGAADGMIAILRRCKPFFRKQLITRYGDYHEEWVPFQPSNGFYPRSHRPNEDPNESFSSSSSPTVSPNSTSSILTGSPSFSSCSASYTYSSSQASSASVGSSHANQYQQQRSSRFFQHNNAGYYALRGVPIGSINSIRNLDREQSRIRPLTSLHIGNEPDLVDATTPLPAGYLLRKHQIQELEEEEVEESTLEQEFEAMVNI
ncbi:hypothetical protein BGZ74_005741 [Mortierella antarctica]|nr:hypothetical protein BGZ74_005741 [Mortierella antarctica]